MAKTAINNVTYVIVYVASYIEKKHPRAYVKAATPEEAVEKWRDRYHRYDCQGCTGDYPIIQVYVKGTKPPACKKTYDEEVREKNTAAAVNELKQFMKHLKKKYNIA